MIIPFKTDTVRLTSPYGKRVLNGKTNNHSGYDLVGVGSKEVVAVVGGKVVQSRIVTDKSSRTWEWGNYVCIRTDEGTYHYYCHLESRAVTQGQIVKPGDKLGIMGNTGYSFGAHLHFEVRLSDGHTAVHPESVLAIPNKVGTYECPKKLETGNDIVWELMNGKYKVNIQEVDKAVKAVDNAKNNSNFHSLYWILYKLVNENG